MMRSTIIVIAVSGMKSLMSVIIPIYGHHLNHWMPVLPFLHVELSAAIPVGGAADAFWRYLNNLVENVDGSPVASRPSL